jgi:acyl-CoA reductase-like NAD-dependent aldehyde dehydrogenase
MNGEMIRIEANTIGQAIAKDDGQICKNPSRVLVRKRITVAETIMDVKNDMTSAKQ